MKTWIIESTSRSFFNPLARFIMWKQKTNFSHMAILITDKNLKTSVYHATWPVSQALYYDDFIAKYKIVNIYALEEPTHATYQELIDFLQTSVRTKAYYSISQLILIYIQTKASWLKTALKMAVLNHEHGLICSELVGRFLNFGWRVQFDDGFDSLDLIETSKVARLLQDESLAWLE